MDEQRTGGKSSFGTEAEKGGVKQERVVRLHERERVGQGYCYKDQRSCILRQKGVKEDVE